MVGLQKRMAWGVCVVVLAAACGAEVAIAPTDAGVRDAGAEACTEPDAASLGCVWDDCIPKDSGTGAPVDAAAYGDNHPVVLVDNLKLPRAIALDRDHVYWVDAPDTGSGKPIHGSVQRRPKASCGDTTPITLATGVVAGTLAVDDKNAYFATDNGIVACATSGCGDKPTTLAAGQLTQIASDGTNVIWTDGAAIMKCAASGCAGSPTIVATSTVRAFAIAGGSVFWTDGKAVLTCPIVGCGGAPTTFAMAGAPPLGATSVETFGILANSTKVVWLEKTLGGFNLTSDEQQKVKMCSLSGCNGATTILPSSPISFPFLLNAISDTHYYASASRCTLTPLPNVQGEGCAYPRGLVYQEGISDLAVDETSVYWTETLTSPDGTGTPPYVGRVMGVRPK